MSTQQLKSGTKKEHKMSLRFDIIIDKKYVESKWTLLKNAIQDILKKHKSINQSFEELYDNAYTLLMNKHAEILYTDLKELVTDYIELKVRECVLKSSSNNFLMTLNQAWNDHQISMVIIRNIFINMDRIYAQRNDVDVYNLGLIIFRDQVVGYGCIRDHLRKTLLDMIMRERQGEKVDRISIKNACQMLVTLGINSRLLYEEVFEKPFLQQSLEFYKVESQKLLAKNNASEYIKTAEARLNEESDRAKHCLEYSTESRITEIVLEELIKKHMKIIVEMENSGVAHMLKHRNSDDLTYMYKLFGRVTDGMKTISDCVIQYLREQGKPLIQEPATKAITFVQNILAFKDDIENFFKTITNDKHIIPSVFEYLVNFNPKSLLLLFTDYTLKKEENIRSVLEMSTYLFRFLLEKDVFEGYYRQHLAKHLLLNKPVSNDWERNMISILKTECGNQFTYKLERMLKDMTVSDTIMDEFKECISESKSNLMGVDLFVKVLTTSFWPIQSATIKCHIPDIPLSAFECFRRFYFAKHSSRKLTLQPQLGNANLNAVFYGPKNEDSNKNGACSFSPRKHIIQVSTYQMFVLMLFNNHDKLTYEEILNKSNIPERDLIKALRSLAMDKTAQRILHKNPRTKNIEFSHEFYVNESFTSKLYKIKIQAVETKGESEPERHETRNKVDEDRTHEIEALTVRIMKSKKRMAHSILVTEITEQLKNRFIPPLPIIKKVIEGLIEREYLARTPEDKKVYTYLA